MDDLYPLRMRSVFKDYLWGGSAIKDVLKKKTPYKKTAESWEVSCHKDGKTVIDNGVFEGKTLEDLTFELKEALLGELCEESDFPLLFKIIDADRDLSVQVHPDDVYAGEYENGGKGKTEMWYVLDAKPGAKLAYGFNRELTIEEYKEAIKSNKLVEFLNYIEVQKGDCIFVEAGKAHAIGEGILIAEIQQNSNLTYRVYDYGREDEFGTQRPLHIEKALEVTTLEKEEKNVKLSFLSVESGDTVRSMLACCRFFAAECVKSSDCAEEKTDGRSFHIIFFISGGGEIESGGNRYEFSKGDSFVMPADMGEYTIKGKCKYLKYYIPEFEYDFLQPLVDAGYTDEEVIALLK